MRFEQRNRIAKARLCLRLPELAAQRVGFQRGGEGTAIVELGLLLRLGRSGTAQYGVRVLRLGILEKLLGDGNPSTEYQRRVVGDEVAHLGGNTLPDLCDRRVGVVEASEPEQRKNLYTNQARLRPDRRIHFVEARQNLVEA